MFIFKFLTFLIALVTIPILFADRISPAIFWPAGFATYLILPILILNVLLLIFWVYKRSFLTAFLLIPSLVIGHHFFFRTFSFHLNNEEKGSVTVLSYNVRVFNVYDHLNKNKPEIAKNMLSWINSDNSDIKCFQDFYNDNKSNIHNTLEKLSQNGKYKYYFTKTSENRIGASFGVAVFSKYPIIRKGNINFEKSFNKGLYVDVKINKDTIRVINIHLESMSIDEDAILTGEGKKGSWVNLQKVLKNGMIKRALQMEEVESVIANSPHRVILCGDLNEMPYAYTYSRLRKYLRNSFEDAGTGFGFSYNGKLFFLRIDNHFYGEGIKVKSFRTLSDIEFSDHFPLKASYSLE